MSGYAQSGQLHSQQLRKTNGLLLRAAKQTLKAWSLASNAFAFVKLQLEHIALPLLCSKQARSRVFETSVGIV